MKISLIIFAILSVLSAFAQETESDVSTKQDQTVSQTKEKRQIGSNKQAQNYPNHQNAANENEYDDPENAEQTIYGAKPNQFLIRPISPHQHQQHEAYQEPQFRNNAPPNHPLAVQLLQQSQKLNENAYLPVPGNLQNAAKTHNSVQRGKLRIVDLKKEDEAQNDVDAALEQQQQQQQQQQKGVGYAAYVPAQQQRASQPQIQIIPEEQFLNLLKQELEARAYQFQQRQSQAQQQHNAAIAATHKVPQHVHPDFRAYQHEHIPKKATVLPQYIQSNPHHAVNPNHLLYPIANQPQHESKQKFAEQLPPQIAYYQPQISYKLLPNHPLAKSSLEHEIAKLLAANKPSIDDNSNQSTSDDSQQIIADTALPATIEPANHHIQRQPNRNLDVTTHNPHLDLNNQPFVPSFFKFRGSEVVQTPIYNEPPVQRPSVNARKLAPVTFPQARPTSIPIPPTKQLPHYYYNGPEPAYTTKIIPTKQFDRKNVIPTTILPAEKQPAPLYNRQQHVANFYPSPLDPYTSRFAQQPTPQPTAIETKSPNIFNNYIKNQKPAPSQSSIYVSQSTGIASPPPPPSPAAPVRVQKTTEEVKQLKLPALDGKPITQAAFQALLDAGYPVTAVPVPVPVPYEQYVKEHPEYNNYPPPHAFDHLIHLNGGNVPQLRGLQSEPSVKIISSPSEMQGVENRTYRKLVGTKKRHPRGNQDADSVSTSLENRDDQI